MKIQVAFDEKLIREYYTRGSSIFFVIYFEHDGSCYPEDGWMDFGAWLLGEWAWLVDELQPGGLKKKLIFMDGPFALHAALEADGQTVTLTPAKGDIDFVWHVSYIDLIKELKRAIKLVCEEFYRLKIKPRELEDLEYVLKVPLPKPWKETLGE